MNELHFLLLEIQHLNCIPINWQNNNEKEIVGKHQFNYRDSRNNLFSEEQRIKFIQFSNRNR